MFFNKKIHKKRKNRALKLKYGKIRKEKCAKSKKDLQE